MTSQASDPEPGALKQGADSEEDFRFNKKPIQFEVF